MDRLRCPKNDVCVQLKNSESRKGDARLSVARKELGCQFRVKLKLRSVLGFGLTGVFRLNFFMYSNTPFPTAVSTDS